MWTARVFPTLAAMAAVLFANVLLTLTAALAADPPTVKQALGVPPHHTDFEFDTPDAKQYDQCKITAVQEGKASGWLLTGPNGQPLRRFMDTDGNDVVDTLATSKTGSKCTATSSPRPTVRRTSSAG